MENLNRTVYLFVFGCAAAFGQPAQAPAFEAASVKAAPPSDGRARTGMRGGPGTPDPGQITYTNVTLTSVLQRAYDVKSYQVTGPAWLSSERYDIAAKIPPGTTKEQFQLMLQSLLAERFHLDLHREGGELQGYELVAGRNGSKLKVSADADSGAAPQPASPPKTDRNGFPVLDGPGVAMMEGVRGRAVITFLTARAQPLSALVDLLSREFRMPIVDKTGLTGKFDFTLEFAPQAPGALPPPPSMDGSPEARDESGANLMTAVQQQLGLRLSPGKVHLDVLVIDRADRIPIEK
jgi:uncharacterized protein (TIGR03435 family)